MANAQAKKKKRKKNSGASSQFFAVLIVFLAVYIALSLFIAGLIYYSFNNTSSSGELYAINILYDEKKIYDIDEQDANNEYGLYVPFSYLSEIASFGLAGDGDSVTLFLIGSENRIVCQKNSSLIFINDNPIRISAPLLYEDGEYLIPISLIEKYINGIDITYDDEKMICNISSDIKKSDIALKLLLPDSMKNAYFPESYKYYGDVPEESGDVSDSTTNDVLMP